MTGPDLKSIEEQHRGMSEAQLMELARRYEEFAEEVQKLIRAEFARRSLEPPLIEDAEDDGVHPELVTVAQYRDASEAIVVRALLESEGIPCFLQDENLVRMDWLWSNLIGGMRLKVLSTDEVAARSLLAQPLPNPLVLEDGQEFEQPTCPQCGATEVELHDRMLKPAAATLLLTGIPLLRNLGRPEDWRCLKCGCLWRNEDTAGES
jgi:hypothetical protein